MIGALFEAFDDLVNYRRPTQSMVDLVGQSRVVDLSADGLIERAATFVRTLTKTPLETKLRDQAVRFEDMLASESPLDECRNAANAQVSSAFAQRERALAGGLVWRELPMRRSGGSVLRPSKVIIPDPEQIEACVESFDEVRWHLPDVVETLDGLLALELEPPFPGREAIQAYRDAVWHVSIAEKTDHLWGCFLLAQCEATIGQSRQHYQQMLARLGRVQEQAMKDAARGLDNYWIPRMRRKQAAGARRPRKAEQGRKAKAGQKQSAEFLTPPQLATQMGVSKDKVLEWIRSGQLVAINAAVKPGGRPRWRIAIAEVEAFKRRRAAQPPPPPSPRRRKAKPDVEEFY